jgi:hypothetical protein
LQIQFKAVSYRHIIALFVLFEIEKANNNNKQKTSTKATKLSGLLGQQREHYHFALGRFSPRQQLSFNIDHILATKRKK